MVRSFRSAVHSMLFGAIIAQAHLRGFDIDDKAASAFATRALDNIEKRNTTQEAQYGAAIGAIANLPMFFSRIERRTTSKQFLTDESARDLVKTLTVDWSAPQGLDRIRRQF
jgi:hypothetical protein